MKKKLKGSFTVEASLLVPFIIFILFAFLLMIFLVHDRAILHTSSLRSGEYALRQEYAMRYAGKKQGLDKAKKVMEEENKEIQTKLIFLGNSRMQLSSGGVSMRALYHSLKSFIAADVTAKGSAAVNIGGVAVFTGSRIETEKKTGTVIVDYTDDWFRKHLRDGLRKNGDG